MTPPLGQAQAIDPNAAEAREMQKRNNMIQFAAGLVNNAVTAPGTLEKFTPAQLAEYALGVAEQFNHFMARPIEGSNIVRQ